MTDFRTIIENALTDAAGKAISVNEETHLIKDDVLDSLDSAVFLLNVERETGIKLPEAVVDDQDLFNVKNLISYLKAKN